MKWIVFVLLLFLLSCSQNDEKKVLYRFEITYTLHFSESRQLSVDIQIPHSIPERQDIQKIHIRPLPTLDTLSNGDILGHYRFFRVKDSIEIKIQGLVYLVDSLAYLQSAPALVRHLDSASNSTKEWLSTLSAPCKSVKEDSLKALCILQQVNSSLKYVVHESDFALDVLASSKEGDCTEYSHLSAALCRSLGGNAHVLSGLHPRVNLNPAHSWTECQFQEGGKWMQLDATWYGENPQPYVPLSRPPVYFVISSENLEGKRWIRYRSIPSQVRLQSHFVMEKVNPNE